MAGKVNIDREEEPKEIKKVEKEFGDHFKDAMESVPGFKDEIEPDESDTQLDKEENFDKDKDTDEDPNQKIIDELSAPSDYDNEDKSDYKKMYEKEKQRNSSWEGRIKAANSKAKEEAERRAELEQRLDKLEKELESSKSDPGNEEDSDKEILDELTDQFPTLERAMKIIATRIVTERIDKILDEKLNSIKPELDQLKQTVNEFREDISTEKSNSHLDKITDAHPDWRYIVEIGVLERWKSRKKSYEQNAIDHVFSEGSTQEVIDLLQTFKDETGWITRTDTTETSKGKKKKYKSEKDTKLESMQGIESDAVEPDTSDRSPDKNDFSSAFKEAANS